MTISSDSLRRSRSSPAGFTRATAAERWGTERLERDEVVRFETDEGVRLECDELVRLERDDACRFRPADFIVCFARAARAGARLRLDFRCEAVRRVFERA